MPDGGTPAGASTIGTPPARQRLSGEFVAQHQRARIVLGLAEEIVEHGYRDVTVTGIVKRAGVARNTFYDNFANKEECFLAASDLAGEEAMRHVAGAVRVAPPEWADQVRAGVGAFLAYVASESALARVFVVESLAAGPAAAQRYERTVRAVAPFFRLGRRTSEAGDRLPPTLEETIVGGIFWVVYQRIVVGRPEELEGLLGELVEFALTPYLGAAAARRVAEARDN
ncbi:MAG TPA: TetR/AcrR family transcriptional regulator [Solirubrobacterales bacterium]|nr:TetR/AcrR family transcriptional regulator [Solirubrobacterales bacterium]